MPPWCMQADGIGKRVATLHYVVFYKRVICYFHFIAHFSGVVTMTVNLI
jgi:hypothetical protein